MKRYIEWFFVGGHYISILGIMFLCLLSGGSYAESYFSRPLKPEWQMPTFNYAIKLHIVSQEELESIAKRQGQPPEIVEKIAGFAMWNIPLGTGCRIYTTPEHFDYAIRHEIQHCAEGEFHD